MSPGGWDWASDRAMRIDIGDCGCGGPYVCRAHVEIAAALREVAARVR